MGVAVSSLYSAVSVGGRAVNVKVGSIIASVGVGFGVLVDGASTAVFFIVAGKT